MGNANTSSSTVLFISGGSGGADGPRNATPYILVVAGKSRLYVMAPAQIPVFLSQKSSTGNMKFRVVVLRSAWPADGLGTATPPGPADGPARRHVPRRPGTATERRQFARSEWCVWPPVTCPRSPFVPHWLLPTPQIALCIPFCAHVYWSIGNIFAVSMEAGSLHGPPLRLISF